MGYQSWRHVAFLQWRFEPDLVQALLPPELTVDLVDGASIGCAQGAVTLGIKSAARLSQVPAPLVVTLVVDDEAQAEWDRLRRRWFPRERLVVGAHLTLFHALPSDQVNRVEEDVAAVAASHQPFPLAVTEVRSLGRGVALRVRSVALDRLHADLAGRWQPWLTPQDAQRLDAHVTIQNKVSPEKARATLAAVASDFRPREVAATGLAVWRYLGGPWEAVITAKFASLA